MRSQLSIPPASIPSKVYPLRRSARPSLSIACPPSHSLILYLPPSTLLCPPPPLPTNHHHTYP